MMSRKQNLTTLGALAVAAPLVLALGGCKKPPPQGACCTPQGACSTSIQTACNGSWSQGGVCMPNPCPQPPPPPPAEISLKTVAQDMKADPRVQFADDLKVTEENLDLGKAIVKLADAFARGDAKALKPMLARRAQALLDNLQDSGLWEESTKPIEAVRVVFVRDGVDVGGVASVKAPPGNIADVMAKVTAALSTLPPEQLATVGKAMQDVMAGADPASFTDPAKAAELQTKITDALKAAGVSEDVQAKLAEIGKDLAAAAPPAEAPPSSSTGMGVVLAVQDLHGAYLLTWTAAKVGDSWTFTNAPATPSIRPRASLWDNVGPEAFQEMSLASAPMASKMGDESVPSSGGGGGGSGGEPGQPGEPSAPAPSSPSPSPAIPMGPHGPHPHG